MSELLLATDLDGTLIGDDVALQELNNYLLLLRERGKLKLAYVTGRSFQLYKQLESEKLLLPPDALVTAVGTEVYWNGTNLAEDWPSVPNWHRASVENILLAFRELELQPQSEQRPHKVSYFLKPNQEVLAGVHESLEEFGVDIVYSQELYLDILPKGIHKGSALQHLAQAWSIDTSNIIACGDSANDIAMLEISKSVIVGNAKQELIDWATQKNPEPNIYLAQAPFANGILQGLKYFQLV
jgi:hypothetical protein